MWRTAFEEAWAAFVAGSIPHGAAIFDCEGSLISRGRNRKYQRRTQPGVLFGNKRHAAERRHEGMKAVGAPIFHSKLAHAEMNAIMAVDPAAVDLASCTMYATTEPCDQCAAALLATRVGALHYASPDPRGGRADLLLANPRLRRTPIVVIGPHDDDLSLALMTLRATYWIWPDRAGADPVLQPWKTAAPQAIAAGERLLHSGDLAALPPTPKGAAKALAIIQRCLEECVL